MVKTMTNRDFYNAIISNEITEEVIKHAIECVANLDERNAKRSSKSKEINEPIKARIVEFLNEKDFVLGTEVAKSFGDEFTSQKIIGLLNELVKVGTCEKCEVKVEKVGKRMAYKLC